MADEAAEAALDNLLDVAGGGREARGDLTESNILYAFLADVRLLLTAFR